MDVESDSVADHSSSRSSSLYEPSSDLPRPIARARARFACEAQVQSRQPVPGARSLLERSQRHSPSRCASVSRAPTPSRSSRLCAPSAITPRSLGPPGSAPKPGSAPPVAVPPSSRTHYTSSPLMTVTLRPISSSGVASAEGLKGGEIVLSAGRDGRPADRGDRGGRGVPAVDGVKRVHQRHRAQLAHRRQAP